MDSLYAVNLLCKTGPNLLNVAGVNSHRYLVLSGMYGGNIKCSSKFDSLPELNLKSDVVCTSQIRDGLQISPG